MNVHVVLNLLAADFRNARKGNGKRARIVREPAATINILFVVAAMVQEYFATLTVSNHRKNRMDIVKIQTGDEVWCDRAKILDDKVIIRRDGMWIELRAPSVDRLTTENEKLREVVSQCADALAHCYQVTDYPANGKTDQDRALSVARDVLGISEQ